MLVLQKIPDGPTCVTFFEACASGDDNACIFFTRDRYGVHNLSSSCVCKRYPQYELAVEHLEGMKKVHKCPECLSQENVELFPGIREYVLAAPDYSLFQRKKEEMEK